MSQIKSYEESILKDIDETISLSKDLPDEKLRWKPSEEEWSVMETLCHVEEMLIYWVDELERVIADPDTKWGRGLDHAQRLEAVAAADDRQLDDVLAGIEKTKEKVKAAFEKLTEEDLDIEAAHRNPKFGVKPMRFLVEHFLVEHMEVHVNQIKRVLRQYAERN